MKPIISHIVAASENGAIGKNGQLPWNIPEDLKWFKDHTKNKIVIMGRKTYESIGRPLPNRLNIVVTRQENFNVPPNVKVFHTIPDALEFANSELTNWDSEVFIIGGGQIYEESLHLVDKIYLTRVHKSIDGDAFYPNFDSLNFKEKKSESFEEY